MVDTLHPRFEAPYIAPPWEKQQFFFEGLSTPADIYIHPETMKKHRENLFQKLHPSMFDGIAINMNGGLFIMQKYLEYWKEEFEKRELPIFPIEYHRVNGGFAARIDKAVPYEAKGLTLLVGEDVYDSGGTGKAILKDAPMATIMVAVHKTGVPNQISIPRIFAAVKTGNLWLGGNGMNLGGNYPDQESRNYGGILVNPYV